MKTHSFEDGERLSFQVGEDELAGGPKNYLYAIPVDDRRFIVYRPLRPLAFVGNSALIDLILESKRIGPEILRGDNRNAFDFLDSIEFFKSDVIPSTQQGQGFFPTTAVLCLTTRCNFRCIYCYASGGEREVQTLSLEPACAAIDDVCENARRQGLDSFSLGFHGGGEPTLEWDLLKNLTAYARARPLEAEIMVATNGYWNRDQCQWIIDNLDGISLSCDGAAITQDRQRPLAGGGGSFEEVLQTVQLLDAAKASYGIRLTVTEQAIEALPENIRFLCENTECSVFQAEPAFDHGRARQGGTTLHSNGGFADAFMRAYEIAVEAGRHLYYSGARPWLVTTQFCSAPENALILTPEGFLTACYEVCSQEHPLHGNFEMGTVDGVRPKPDPSKRSALLDKLNQRRKLCEECYAFWHCAGDCPSKVITEVPGGYLDFGPRCELNREITRRLLLSYIHREGGVWRGGGGSESVLFGE